MLHPPLPLPLSLLIPSLPRLAQRADLGVTNRLLGDWGEALKGRVPLLFSSLLFQVGSSIWLEILSAFIERGGRGPPTEVPIGEKVSALSDCQISGIGRDDEAPL